MILACKYYVIVKLYMHGLNIGNKVKDVETIWAIICLYQISYSILNS